MIDMKTLNKEEILSILDKLNLDKNEYIILNKASLVLQGLKDQTSKIELAISKNIENLLKDIKVYTTYNNKNVYIYNDIYLTNNFYDSSKYIKINNYKCADLESILQIEKTLNRKEDIKDVKDIDLILCLKDNYRYEKELINKGITLICGIDEVGRGPLVGPVVAASVILPLNFKLEGLTDSKKLSEKKREEFFDIIQKSAISIGIGVIDNKTIDKVNIYEATKLAMISAINNLSVKPEHILIDAMKLDIDIPSTSIIKGDIKSISISAASVIAKVTRDRMLDELGKKYPYYNFKSNKGYPTKEHINAINKYGIIKEHRISYGPVKNYLETLQDNAIINN